MFLRKAVGEVFSLVFGVGLASYQVAKKPLSNKGGFEEVVSGTQYYDRTTAYTHPTPSTDTSGFTDPTPRGAFVGQQLQFKRQAIKQLADDKHVLALRGDARPLDIMLAEGIKPRAANGQVNVEEHRGGLTHKSNCVSLSTVMSVAVAAGANAASAVADAKANQASFTVIAARLSGAKYSAAGPGRIKAQESEVTAAGSIHPNDILGYRNCVAVKNGSGVVCSNIFARNGLKPNEKETVVNALCGKKTF